MLKHSTQFRPRVRSLTPPQPFLATRVDGPTHDTRVTRDFATPAKPTLAVHFLADGAGIVPATAAQQFTSFDARRRSVALSALRAQRPGLPVRLAEVGRLFRVDQIRPAGRLNGRAFGNEAVSVVAWYHFGSAVEPLLETVAHVAESWHLAPARPQRTRSGQAVTLALRVHQMLHRLPTQLQFQLQCYPQFYSKINV